jgi:hypothetical protein
MGEYDQKKNYAHFEIDFGRRLVAKFVFNPATFWTKNEEFPPISRGALYPDAHDPLCKLAQAVAQQLQSD